MGICVCEWQNLSCYYWPRIIIMNSVPQNSFYLFPPVGLKELLDPIETLSSLVLLQLCNYIIHGSRKDVFHKVETSIWRDAGF